VAQGTAVKSPL